MSTQVRKRDYVLIVGAEAPFGVDLMSELAVAGLETSLVSDAQTAKRLLSRKSPPAVVLDIRYSALPVNAAPLVAEARTR